MLPHERIDKLNELDLRLGSHYGPGGKYCVAAAERAIEEGSSALQMFAGNPKRYWPSRQEDSSLEEFRELIEQHNIYAMIHSIYLTNIADHPESRGSKMTKLSLVKQLEWAEAAGCSSLVFHPGSAKKNPREDAVQWLIDGCREVLIDYQGPVRLLLENAAVKGEKVTGRKGNRPKLFGNILELADVVREIDNDRCGVVIDTTHAYASGYSVDRMIEAMEDEAMWDLLDVIHFNTPDLGVTPGSGLDRHSSSFDQDS